jgi:hypothetical protein
VNGAVDDLQKEHAVRVQFRVNANHGEDGETFQPIQFRKVSARMLHASSEAV